MYFFGPYAPEQLEHLVQLKPVLLQEVLLSLNMAPAVTSTQNGMKFFAGPRDDPFFFDLGQFQAILGGTATAFKTQVWILCWFKCIISCG
jgi:hypothetical protein